MKLTRRGFLLASGGAAIAARTRAFAGGNRRIVIAGAGLAGLSAAYELSQKGFRVTVIEGRDRVGGRIHTLRDPFSHDLHVETGGELLGDGYERMLRYCHKFGIEYKELSAEVETGGSVAELQDGIGRTAYMKGKLYPKGTVINNHPYGLTGMEGKVLPPTLYGMNLRLFINEMRRKEKTILDFDKLSLADALRGKGVSERAIKLMDISLNYNSIETASTGGILFDGLRRRTAGTIPIKVVGGNDLIPKALAENARRNGVEFIMSSKVKKVSQGEEGVKITFRNERGNMETIMGDRFVCTIPFSVLKNVKFSPQLPKEKSKAIKELNYTQNTKVYMQAKYAEWDKRVLGSSVWTDTTIERIFSPTGKTGDERAIFTAWTEGNGSKLLERMSEKERMAFARKKFEEVLPFMKGSVERTFTQSWSQDEFARGAYSHFTVGQLASIQPHVRTSVGRIHFAGEHTAQKSPGMEGALESAERVTKEIAGTGSKTVA